jgi:hypothetical protein
MAKDKELTADDKFELLLGALTARQEQGISAETLRDILAANATAVQKAMKPENAQHPGHSAMSYPEGDLARSRESIIPHEFIYNNFPMSKFPETHHWKELELAAQVVPGEYRVLRKDGSPMAVTVTGERDADGKLTKVLLTFPVSREEKWLVPPMVSMLYQILHQDQPKKRFMEAMNLYMEMTLGVETASV